MKIMGTAPYCVPCMQKVLINSWLTTLLTSLGNFATNQTRPNWPLYEIKPLRWPTVLPERWFWSPYGKFLIINLFYIVCVYPAKFNLWLKIEPILFRKSKLQLNLRCELVRVPEFIFSSNNRHHDRKMLQYDLCWNAVITYVASSCTEFNILR